MNIKKNLDKATQIEASGTMAEIFEVIAGAQEVFAEENCYLCDSPSKFQVRNVADGKKSYVYYEKICLNPSCRAKLAFGQHSEGDKTLFPKRKNEEGKYDREGRGWTRYNPNAKQND